MVAMLNKLNDLYYWILHRTVDRYHVIKTGLEPGYHDKDYILLHVAFNLLKDFVECELAWMNYITIPDDTPENKTKISTYRYDYLMAEYLFCEFRAPELGLEYLDWEISLKGRSNASQRSMAREAKKLYLWWVVDRPARKEDYKLEEKYGEEDQKMFHRLINIRSSLWT